MAVFLSFMKITMRLIFFPLLFLAANAFAQDGGQLYATYCSACHAEDGRGATGGAFPPLAGSSWLADPADRAVKVVLHGLDGPVQVSGKSYNLAMPPQGAVLTDDVIAAILTYVRSSWGNKEKPVTPTFVKSIREQTQRDKPWTGSEILKLHPLKVEPSALKNLISRTYLGKWNDLPDFSKLTSENVEEEHDGLISLDQATVKTDHFGLVWEAEFEANKDGEYQFYFDADDGGRVVIDGKTLVEIRKLGPMNGSRSKVPKIRLSKGLHPIRIEYYEVTQNQGVQLGWKGPDVKEWKWLSKEAPTNTKRWPDIPIEPTANRTAIYRNFIAGTTPRAIGFGFPGGLNLAWSADHLGPELLWTGKFMDGGHHWTDRGTGNEPPAGGNVVKLSNGRALPENARFQGYQLDKEGNPTFRTKIGDQILSDSWKAGTTAGQADRQPAFTRQLSWSGGSSPLEIVISDLFAAAMFDDHEYSLGDQLFIHAEGSHPEVRNGKTVLTLPPGQSATLTYRWKK